MQAMAGMVHANESEQIQHHNHMVEERDEDMFGADDDDWDVYRLIQTKHN
jgi:hypothetical protein